MATAGDGSSAGAGDSANAKVEDGLGLLGLSLEQDEPELHVLTLPDVYVHRIPPMRGSSGHRAADWNIEKPPALIGQLKLVSKGDTVHLQLWKEAESSSQLPTLFANCPIKLNPDSSKADGVLEHFVQGVTDSSRYFAVRVVDEKSGRHAFVGIGFQARESAFSLRAALKDELKHVARGGEEEENVDNVQDTTPKVDRSFKDGETIKVKIKLGGKKKKAASKPVGGGLSLSAPPSALKAPPSLLKSPVPAPAAPGIASAPAATATAPATATESNDASQQDAEEDWGEFGDFQ